MQRGRNHFIDIEKIRDALKASVFVGDRLNGKYVTGVYASDLMSDVLAYGKAGSLLLTGLNTVQAAVSAYVAEFKGIIFLRSKVPDSDILDFAKDKHLVVLSTDDDMYEACVKIAGIEGEVPVAEAISEPAKKGRIHHYTYLHNRRTGFCECRDDFHPGQDDPEIHRV